MQKSVSAVVAMAGGLLLWAGVAQADGATVYARCKACHGADGKGNAAMKVPGFGGASEAEMTKTIREGKGKMPAYAGKISDAEIADVIKHIKTLK